jgi:peroxiredoxin
MTIKVGDRLPAGRCRIHRRGNRRLPIGPNKFQVEDLTKGKKVVIFGCRAHSRRPARQSTSSYVANIDKLKAGEMK